MHAQVQTSTSKRNYTIMQDSSPEDTFVDCSPECSPEDTFIDGAEAIFCPIDVQELIEEMFPQVEDLFSFISDHEAETNRYNAKKQCLCNAKPTAQPTAADMLGNLADSKAGL